MKKRFILLLTFILIITTLFSGCTEEKNTSEIIHSEKVQETSGNYYLFQTKYVQEYLNFLENFDETKYEIVDISTSLHLSPKGSNEFYMITYRVLPQY